MSKHVSARPQPVPASERPDFPVSPLNGPTHRVVCVRRSGGMWLFEAADIPADVWAQYVIPSKTHGPDLYGMCSGQAEYEMSRIQERG